MINTYCNGMYGGLCVWIKVGSFSVESQQTTARFNGSVLGSCTIDAAISLVVVTVIFSLACSFGRDANFFELVP